MERILIIDNYDSFTYNLVHYIGKLTNTPLDVYRNDEITLEEVNNYTKILLSPGPGIPTEAGICLDLIRKYAPTKSIFGVCLGHQAIGEAFGGKLINLDKVYHGVATPIKVNLPNDPLYHSLPETFLVGRYHSWAISTENFPSEMNITSVDQKGMIMGLSHKKYNVRGVQFHPESVLTEHGLKIVENWLTL